MIFEVQGKTEKYIKLSKDKGSKGIEFLASRKLVEYEIQMEDLNFRTSNNISQGVVKFVFRRNMEFHVTNTFLQTFLLVCVGYFSYYFDVDNFSDRIMVVLTTMLVVATITTSIQDVRKSVEWPTISKIVKLLKMLRSGLYGLRKRDKIEYLFCSSISCCRRYLESAADY